MANDPAQPLLRVVRGEPMDDELAALTVVIAALASAPAHEPPLSQSMWADPARRLQVPQSPGPGSWRISGLTG